ncbi:DUF2793 domain-containing protein [Xanthobacter flavus]|uniref:DUF2793 domain-containing protein n=1 Tax=Xanthobacter flavus TaxID=281 RepID=UPI0037284B56
MAFTNFYGAGTISVSANSTAVTGVGTLWSATVLPGDTLEAGGRAVRVLSVTDDTHLTLAYGWPGSTLAGSAYMIVYNSPDRNSGTYVAERTRELIERQRILAGGANFYSVKQVNLNTPPGSPVADDLYVVGTSPTGAWSGYAGYLAVWLGSAWGFTAPEQGWFAYGKNADFLYVRTASAWVNWSSVTVAQVGAANGVASLDSGAKVPVAQMPAPGVRSLCLTAADFTPRTTNGAAPGLVETSSNKRMVRTLDFDASTAEYAQVCVPMPKSWNKGSFSVRLIWQPATGAIGNVLWAIRAACVDYYDGTDNLDRTWGTPVSHADPTSGVSTATCYSVMDAITPSGTPAENALLFIEVYRDAAAGADTYAADAKLVALFVHVTLNAFNDA